MRKPFLSILLPVLALFATPVLANEVKVASAAETEEVATATEVAAPESELPAPPTEASESSVSGGVDVLSDYMLADGVRPTKGWVVQPYASLDLGGGLSANAWGSVGLETSNGNELDIGLTYEKELGGGVTGRLTAVHYVLFGGVPDMQELTVGVEKDGFDLSASYFPWAGGLQDGFRAAAKYNFAIAPRLSASVGVVYETGMEADDTFVPQASLTYNLGRGFSAKLNAYFPHWEDGVHERRVVFGIGWGF